MTKARIFQKTHPWLRFEFDSRKLDSETWMLLGEAQSKCQHVSGVPLRPVTAQELHRLYLAKGVAATTAIEGNTLTEEDIQKQIRGELQLPPSKEYLAKETDNILQACNEISGSVIEGMDGPLSAQRIRDYNRKVLDGLEVQDHVVPGEYTKSQVGVGRYRGAPPGDIEFLMERLCDWLNGPDFADPTGKYPIVHGLLKAIMAHLYLAWIHPFGDGNGRTARMIEFRLLLEAGTPTPTAHLLSNHYNLTRSRYYLMLERASSNEAGDYMPFVKYAIEGFVDGLKEQLGLIKDQQIDVAWRNYVHELMGKFDGKLHKRCRQLILDVSRQTNPVPFDQLKYLTPAVSQAYDGMSELTVKRDVKWLVEQGLLLEVKGGYQANKDIILAFLPRRAEGKSGG